MIIISGFFTRSSTKAIMTPNWRSLSGSECWLTCVEHRILAAFVHMLFLWVLRLLAHSKSFMSCFKYLHRILDSDKDCSSVTARFYLKLFYKKWCITLFDIPCWRKLYLKPRLNLSKCEGWITFIWMWCSW